MYFFPFSLPIRKRQKEKMLISCKCWNKIKWFCCAFVKIVAMHAKYIYIETFIFDPYGIIRKMYTRRKTETTTLRLRNEDGCWKEIEQPNRGNWTPYKYHKKENFYIKWNIFASPFDICKETLNWFVYDTAYLKVDTMYRGNSTKTLFNCHYSNVFTFTTIHIWFAGSANRFFVTHQFEKPLTLCKLLDTFF